MKITERYAQALWLAWSDKTGEQGLETHRYDGMPEVIHDFFEHTTALLQDIPELVKYLENPMISWKAKQECVTELMVGKNFPQVLERFLCYIIRQRRLKWWITITQSFWEISVTHHGWTYGVVQTPTALDASLLQAISIECSEALNKKVVLRAEIVPSLILGIKIIIQGYTYDYSVAGMLNTFSAQVKPALMHIPS